MFSDWHVEREFGKIPQHQVDPDDKIAVVPELEMDRGGDAGISGGEEGVGGRPLNDAGFGNG